MCFSPPSPCTPVEPPSASSTKRCCQHLEARAAGPKPAPRALCTPAPGSQHPSPPSLYLVLASTATETVELADSWDTERWRTGVSCLVLSASVWASSSADCSLTSVKNKANQKKIRTIFIYLGYKSIHLLQTSIFIYRHMTPCNYVLRHKKIKREGKYPSHLAKTWNCTLIKWCPCTTVN